MSKANKKLLAEIQNGLKQVDEGVAQLEILEGKVENASTISIKEKYRQDMKREIKRLQRLRDLFRQNVNNPAVSEQHKLVEARKRIENEMEKFRDHEKEYKSKRPTKAAMLNETEIKGKFNYGSGSDFDGDFSDEEGSNQESEAEMTDENEAPDIHLDRQWLANFISETLRTIIGQYDSEQEKIQNKKTKGGQKKNRDKINALKNKKSQFQHVKDRAEELQITIDYLEAGQIRSLRQQVKQLNANTEDDGLRNTVLNEINQLIEISEQNRRAQAPNSGSASLKGANQSASIQGRVQIDQLNLRDADDLVTEDLAVNQLRMSHILDAQDIYGSWHLSIVIDDGSSQGTTDKKTLHFLPFQKANRDEQFLPDDQARIAPAFTRHELKSGDQQPNIQTLYNYLETHLKKTGQAPPVPGQYQKHGAASSASHEETKGGAPMRPGQLNQAASAPAHQAKSKTGAFSDEHSRLGTGDGRSANAASSTNSSQPGLQQQKGKPGKLQQWQAGANQQIQDEQQHLKQAKLGGDQRAYGGRDAQDLFSSNPAQQDFGQHHPELHQLQNNSGTDHNSHSNSQAESSLLDGQGMGHGGDDMLGMPMFTGTFGGLGQPGLQGRGPDVDFEESEHGVSSLPGHSGHQLGQHHPISLNEAGGSTMLLQGAPLGSLGGLNQSPPPLVKDTTQSERKHNLELLDASFRNIPTKQDQMVFDPKHPQSVWEEHNYPRVPLYNRTENFARFDLETLFFAFYYQQGTDQQYLAAVELKRKNWKFVKKFETWFKKVEPTSESGAAYSSQGNGTSGNPGTQAPGSASAQASSNGAQPGATNDQNAQRNDQSSSANAAASTSATKDVGKYIFFDFENGWQQLVRDDFELDLSQIENELVVQPAQSSQFILGSSTTANALLGAPAPMGHPGAQILDPSQSQMPAGVGSVNAPSRPPAHAQ